MCFHISNQQSVDDFALRIRVLALKSTNFFHLVLEKYWCLWTKEYLPNPTADAPTGQLQHLSFTQYCVCSLSLRISPTEWQLLHWFNVVYTMPRKMKVSWYHKVQNTASSKCNTGEKATGAQRDKDITLQRELGLYSGPKFMFFSINSSLPYTKKIKWEDWIDQTGLKWYKDIPKRYKIGTLIYTKWLKNDVKGFTGPHIKQK